MKSKRNILYLIGALVLFAGVAYWAYFRKVYKPFKADSNLLEKRKTYFNAGGLNEYVSDELANAGDTWTWVTREVNYGNNSTTFDNIDFARGFLKGLNIEPTGWAIGLFENEIRAYANHPDRRPYKEVTVGEFLQ